LDVHYVNLLISARSTNRRYVGVTIDLKRRLADHNAGKSPHTAQAAKLSASGLHSLAITRAQRQRDIPCR
jgi:predicted GIY-YIG superfamily endonuclease